MNTLLLIASAFALEWNSTYRTDVPYEVELSPAKIGARSFTVFADGKALSTSHYKGKLPGTVAVRFRVPAGTKALTCEGTDKAAAVADAAADNLFAGCLDAANVGKWTLGNGVKAEAFAGGIRFRGTATGQGGHNATYTVDVPAGLAGAPVMQELTLKSLAKLAWGGHARIRQLDAAGKLLAESVADGRWTTHMRPPQKLTEYRDEGHIHPKAKKLRPDLELRTLGATYDDYGLKITDPSVRLPVLEVTRVALRPAELLPFPKWNDGFFAAGVSGEPGDWAMRFGGDDAKGMFYQMTSRGSWTDSVQFREETDRYFPAGAGTVEAWFRPDWAAVAARRTAKKLGPRPVVLFEGYQGYRAAQCIRGKGVMMQLRYHPVEKTLGLTMNDWNGHNYEKDFKGVEIADGAWSHLALQWTPKGEARVFVNGRAVATLPIPEYEAIPIADKTIENVNDLWAMEFCLGTTCAAARLQSAVPADWPLFEGAADAFRVSTGCRYDAKGFVPAKAFKADGDTRALFSFDRWFDGVSGGGFGLIPASVHALVDRVDHTLVADGKALQYYPAANLPENDPAKVLNINNYPVLPKPAEYLAARKAFSKTAELAAGEKMTLTCGPTAYAEYIEFANLSKDAPVRYPILVNKGRLDPRSFGDLADSLGLAGLSDRDKANRTFQYVLSASDYFMNHQLCISAGSDTPHSACYEAMIMLNSYCGFECGPLNNLAANMFSTVAYCPAAQTGGYGHSFEQVFYDGKNHIYDLSAQKFFPAMDNETAAYLKEVGDQPGIHNRVGSDADAFMRKSTRGHGAQDPSYQEKCALTLNPGEKFRVWYSNDGCFNNLQTWSKKGVYGSKSLKCDEYDFADVAALDQKSQWVKRMDRVFPQYSTGVISFDGPVLKDSPALEQVADRSFCYRISCCYPIAWGEYAAYGEDGKAFELDCSTDFGKTFKALPRNADGTYNLEYRVKGRHEYLIRVEAPLAAVTRFHALTKGEVNTRTYPGWVTAGANELTFKAEPGDRARVTVAWTEPANEIVIEQGAYSGTIPGCERQLVLVDPAKGLTLGVTGASAQATVRTFGKLKATLKDGKLTLAYDATRPLGLRRGDDLEEWYGKGGKDIARRTFPTVAGVEIADGDAVKRLTAIVSPNARFLRAEEAVLTNGATLKPADADSVQSRVWLTSAKGKATFSYAALPAGKYEVFALARFPSHPDVCGSQIRFANPNPQTAQADPFYDVSRYINGNEDYLKAHYGQKGGRARWKWDTVNLIGREFGQTTYSGWIIRTLDFPETTKLDFSLSCNNAEGVELAAVLVLPDPDLECRSDLRKLLFGLNCDPWKVR